MIAIKRERWIITRNDTDIFCGLARNYKFKSIAKIGDAAVKTYLSEKKQSRLLASHGLKIMMALNIRP